MIKRNKSNEKDKNNSSPKIKVRKVNQNDKEKNILKNGIVNSFN